VRLAAPKASGVGVDAIDSDPIGKKKTEVCMSDHIYKKITLVGSSTISSDDAIRNAIARANETVNNMNWFEVVETRGHIENGQVAHWQVTIEIGFRLKD
jgi:flavin-binding protein dodecin